MATITMIISSIATALTRTIVGTRVWRVFRGIGIGGMEPVNVGMIGTWWQEENRGYAVGAHHTRFPMGQFFGRLLIVEMLAVATWREAFLFIPLVAIPIVILQIVLARRRNLEKVNGWIREHDMTPSVEEREIEERHWENLVGSVNAVLSDPNVRSAIIMAFCIYSRSSV